MVQHYRGRRDYRGRRGEILGKLVWGLVLLLLPVWALGHWVASGSSANAANSSGQNVAEEIPRGSSPAGSAATGTGQPESSGRDSLDPVAEGNVSDADETASNGMAARELTVPESGQTETATRGIANAAVDQGELVALTTASDQLNVRVQGLSERIGELDSSFAQQAQRSSAIEASIASLDQSVTQTQSQLIERVDSLQDQVTQAMDQVARAVDTSPADSDGEVVMPTQPKSEPDLRSQPQTRPQSVGDMPATEVTRMWTGTNGKQVQASFVAIEGSDVLLRARGRIFRVPMKQLTTADQDYARSLVQ